MQARYEGVVYIQYLQGVVDELHRKAAQTGIEDLPLKSVVQKIEQSASSAIFWKRLFSAHGRGQSPPFATCFRSWQKILSESHIDSL